MAEHICPRCKADWRKGEFYIELVSARPGEGSLQQWMPAVVFCHDCKASMDRALKAYHGPGVDEGRATELILAARESSELGEPITKLPYTADPAVIDLMLAVAREQRAHDDAKVAGLVEAMESIAGRGYAGASFVANEALRAYRGQEA